MTIPRKPRQGDDRDRRLGPAVWIPLGLVLAAVVVLLLLKLLGSFGGADNPDLDSPPSVPDYSAVTPVPSSS